MKHWRLAVLAVLFVLPVLFLAGVGSVALYRTGWAFAAWWPMAACFAVAYFLAWRWQRKRVLLPQPDAELGHWTERDKAAWALVKARADAAEKLPVDKLAEASTYLTAAQAMAEELARHYHPTTRDPFGRVTIPELLTVAELATHDLSQMVDEFLPGGHLLTVDDWRRAGTAIDWYQKGRTAYWMLSALFDPIHTGARFAASKIGIAQPLDALQQDLVDWVYVAYLNRLGAYLIELYSGRLQVGAKRYRERVGASAVVPLTVALFGQVKAGKSSLANALTESASAFVDALPATNAVGRYRAKSPDGRGELIVTDTVGYGHEGPKADDLRATTAVAQGADVMILVLHARTAARAADVIMLEQLRTFFDGRPDLRRPPLIVVLTHVDLLSPALEWSPPYDWLRGSRPKEKAMADAVAAARESFPSVAAILPVCAAAGKVWNVREGIIPVMADQLDEARATALVRALGGGSAGVGKVLEQLKATGAAILGRLLQIPAR